jgi:hypothetical protein
MLGAAREYGSHSNSAPRHAEHSPREAQAIPELPYTSSPPAAKKAPAVAAGKVSS